MLFRSEAATVEQMLIRGVTKDTNVARISLTELKDQPGIAHKVFSLLANNRINVDIILQSIGREDTKDITFTVAEDNADLAVEVLRSAKESIAYRDILCDKDIAKVSIVGAGMESNPGIASKMFGALADANVNIQMISTSEIKISVLININDAQRAVNAIHNAFFSV